MDIEMTGSSYKAKHVNSPLERLTTADAFVAVGLAEPDMPEIADGEDSENVEDVEGIDDGDDVEGGHLLASTEPGPSSLPPSLLARLYLSHLLSTWNTRMFEFAAVLFLAAAYPDSLRPVSIYAVVRGLAAIVLADWVGAHIDHGDRLAVVRASIVAQRTAVLISCAVFWWMFNGSTGSTGSAGTTSLFPLVPLVLAACVEKLAAVANLVAVERDWVVVLTNGDDPTRRLLNARMRRIDLFCKLAGPLAIALLIAAASVPVALAATAVINTVSVGIEYFCIAAVYHRCPSLRRPEESADSASDTSSVSVQVAWYSIRAAVRRLLPASLPFYLGHPAVLPSVALAMLYLTVLSFAGQMVTYLLSVGYSAAAVGFARTASTVLELSATWAAPRLVSRVGDIRAGLWSLAWQSAWLTVGVAWFWAHLPARGVDSDSARMIHVTSDSPRGAATGLALGVALSRVGLWGFDLCAQNIVQEEVDVDHRGTFSTAEAAFQNLFEVLAYVMTMVFPRPNQFRWPVLVSLAAVYAAAILYAVFVRQRRGHLFHSPLPPAQRWIEKTFTGGWR